MIVLSSVAVRMVTGPLIKQIFMGALTLPQQSFAGLFAFAPLSPIRINLHYYSPGSIRKLCRYRHPR